MQYAESWEFQSMSPRMILPSQNTTQNNRNGHCFTFDHFLVFSVVVDSLKAFSDLSSARTLAHAITLMWSEKAKHAKQHSDRAQLVIVWFSWLFFTSFCSPNRKIVTAPIMGRNAWKGKPWGSLGKQTKRVWMWHAWTYRVGQKSKPDNFCNNFVYWHPIFI